MKKLNCLLMLAMMMIATTGVISCSDDDDLKVKTSPIVGTWVAVSEYVIDTLGRRSNSINTGDKWVFTDNTLTINRSKGKSYDSSREYKFHLGGMVVKEQDTISRSGSITYGPEKIEVVYLYKTRLEIKQKTYEGYKYTNLMREDSNIQNEEQYIKQLLIGTWRIGSELTENKSGNDRNYSNDLKICVFTDSTFTIYDNYDLLYGQTKHYKYSFERNQICYNDYYNYNSHRYDIIRLVDNSFILTETYSLPIPCTPNVHRISDYVYKNEISLNKIEDIPRWTDTMDITFDATSSQKDIDLTKLDVEMNFYSYDDNPWAFMCQYFYKTYIMVQENTSTLSRTCDITAVGPTGNKIIIHIIQKGKDETPNP